MRSLSDVRDYTQSQKMLASIAQTAPAPLRKVLRPNKGSWQSHTVLLGAYTSSQEAEIQRRAEQRYNKRVGRAKSARNTDEFFEELHDRAEKKKVLRQTLKEQGDSQFCEQFTANGVPVRYSEANEVFMCIRITKELKQIYDSVLRIDLNKKVSYPLFLLILFHLGYLEKSPSSANFDLACESNTLTQLAWRTIFTKCAPEELAEEQEESGPQEETSVECVTFENFAMLLNLINNVYIKNNVQARSANEVILEEEEGSEHCGRPYGYVDSQGRFMASSQAEVTKIYRRFYPLMVNKRTNHQTKTKIKPSTKRQVHAFETQQQRHPKMAKGKT